MIKIKGIFLGENQKKNLDPYQTWISEIMLQQTTVQAVIPFFHKFINKWPTINKLSESKVEDVMDAWSGLGYYSRAKNIHKTAEISYFIGEKNLWGKGYMAKAIHEIIKIAKKKKIKKN